LSIDVFINPRAIIFSKASTMKIIVQIISNLLKTLDVCELGSLFGDFISKNIMLVIIIIIMK
jgi:hypothetical protein